MEGLPLSGTGLGGFLGGRAHGFVDFGVGLCKKLVFLFVLPVLLPSVPVLVPPLPPPCASWTSNSPAASGCAGSLTLCLLGCVCWLCWRLGGATRLGGVFVLVGSFFLCPEVPTPFPPRPFPAVLESVFILHLAWWVVHFVAVFSHFPRAQKILGVYLYLSSGQEVGGVFRSRGRRFLRGLGVDFIGCFLTFAFAFHVVSAF